MLEGEITRRSVLTSSAILGMGLHLAPAKLGPEFRRQSADPIAIDRSIDDLVVLPAEPGATVTGTSSLDPDTEFTVRVASRESPTFFKSNSGVITNDGTWAVSFDLLEARGGRRSRPR